MILNQFTHNYITLKISLIISRDDEEKKEYKKSWWVKNQPSSK